MTGIVAKVSLGRQVSAFPVSFRLRLRVALLDSSLFAPGGSQPNAPPAQLKSVTSEAFDRYVRLTQSRNDAELKSGEYLLWIDGLDATQRIAVYNSLKRGEVQMQKLETLDNGAAIHCPSGMIHHWVGSVFIPGVRVNDVLAVLEDYDHHAEYYAPDVERSVLESRDGDHFRAFLRFRRHKVITVVLDTEHDIRYFRDSESRAHSRSSATRIAQVENAGKSDERRENAGRRRRVSVADGNVVADARR